METCKDFEQWWLQQSSSYADTKKLCWEAWNAAAQSLGKCLKSLQTEIHKLPVDTGKLKVLLSELSDSQRKEIFDFLEESYCPECGAYKVCECRKMNLTNVRNKLILVQEHIKFLRRLEEMLGK